MLSIEECRRLLGKTQMSDSEIAEFLDDLRTFLSRLLDDHFRDDFDPDEV